MNTYTDNYIYLCNRFILIKVCLCCFLDMHLYYNNLSTIPTFLSSIILDLVPVYFSCSNNFNLSRSSIGSDGKNIVEIPGVMIAGDLSNLIRNLSR